jgi:hypothetical protein
VSGAAKKRPEGRQFRALLRLHLRETFAQFKVSPTARSTTGRRLYALSLGFFALFGVIGSTALYNFRALGPAYLVYLTLGFFILLYLVTTNLTTVLIQPEDSDRILFRPIPPQAYFLSRYLTAALMMMGWLAAYWAPMAALHLWGGLYIPLLTLTVALILLGFSVFPTAFAIAWAAGRVRRTLWGFSGMDLVQLGLSVVLLFSLGFTIRWMTPTGEQADILWKAPGNPWLLLLPSYWFLPIGLLGNELLSGFQWVAAGLGSVLAVVGTALIFRHWQGFLVEMAHRRSAERTAAARAGALIPEAWLAVWARNVKTRAVARMMVRYATRESRIRMPLITMALTSAFLVVFLLFIAPLPDTLDPVNRSLFSTIRVLEKMLYYLCLAFILLMQVYTLVLTQSSEHWEGDWVWWVSPIKPGVIRNAAFAVVTAFTLPIYAVLVALILARYGWDWRLPYEALTFWLFAGVIVQGILANTNYVPYSRPSGGPLMDYWTVLLVLLLPAVGYLGVGATTLYVKKSLWVAIGVPVALMAANLGLYLWMERVPFKEQSHGEVL